MNKKLGNKIVLIICSVLVLVCGVTFNINKEEYPGVSEEQIRKNSEYFDIVNMIYSGDYDKAENKIEEVYGDVSYEKEVDSGNKMRLYSLLYNEQELYDEEFLVIMDYLQANDIIRYRNMEKDEIDDVSILSAINSVREIKGVISEENRQMANYILGEKLFTDKTIEEYDKEFHSLIEYLQINNIDIDKYKEMEKDDIEDLEIRILIANVIEIKDLISEENRQLANEIFGENLLN